VLKRSILTEKIARRGLHVSREYAVDELEILFVRDVMTEDMEMLRAGDSVTDGVATLEPVEDERSQHLFPVLDDEANVVGAATRTELLAWAADPALTSRPLATLVKPANTVVPAETLRGAVRVMAAHDVTALLVVNPANEKHLVGAIQLHDLLKARARHLEDEQRRERVLPWEYILPQWIRPKLARGKSA